MTVERTLEMQRTEFSQRRLIATPIAGLIAWLIVGISTFFFEPYTVSIVLFIATGSIVYLGMFISKFTGEDFLAKDKPKNAFDTLFFYSVGMSVLVYSIAIPFYLIDYTSLPLTVGVLTGLMWLPISWIIQHWIGIVHCILRVMSVVIAWYAFPEDRFFVIPVVIVLLYCFAIFTLEMRWRKLESGS